MKRFLSAALACCIGVTTAVAPGGGAAGEPTSKTKKADKPLTAAEQAAVNSGVLTAQEAQLGCKRMAGRMKIRILELRGGGVERKGSAAAQGMQSTLVPIFGGTTRGANAQGDRADDLADLKAMNEILVARNCPYYDLQGELAKGHDAPSPRLIRSKDQAGKGKKAKARGEKAKK